MAPKRTQHRERGRSLILFYAAEEGVYRWITATRQQTRNCLEGDVKRESERKQKHFSNCLIYYHYQYHDLLFSWPRVWLLISIITTKNRTKSTTKQWTHSGNRFQQKYFLHTLMAGYQSKINDGGDWSAGIKVALTPIQSIHPPPY